MAVTSTSLVVRFPSMSTASTTLIDACLAAARLRVPNRIWGDLEDEGVLHLAAHLITLDPAGVKARKVNQTGMSVYLAEYNRLVGIVGSGFRVTGDTSAIILT